MKWFLLAALAFVLPVSAQTPAGPTMPEAVRAYNSGNLESARMMFETIAAAEPRNQAAKNYLKMIADQQKESRSLANTLKKVTLAKVSLEDTSAREAMTFVSQQVQKQTDGKQTVNIVWMAPEGQDTKVTLKLENIPASEALRYIADAANLELAFDAFAVKVKPAKAN